jgi:hypothetical protein
MEFLEEDFGAFDLSQKMDVSSYTVVNSMRYTYTNQNSSNSSSEDESKHTGEESFLKKKPEPEIFLSKIIPKLDLQQKKIEQNSDVGNKGIEKSTEDSKGKNILEMMDVL